MTFSVSCSCRYETNLPGKPVPPPASKTYIITVRHNAADYTVSRLQAPRPAITGSSLTVPAAPEKC